MTQEGSHWTWPCLGCQCSEGWWRHGIPGLDTSASLLLAAPLSIRALHELLDMLLLTEEHSTLDASMEVVHALQLLLHKEELDLLEVHAAVHLEVMVLRCWSLWVVGSKCSMNLR